MATPRQRGFVVDPIVLTHWRFKEAGLAGTGLWTLAASWCVEHETDGHIPVAAMKALMPGAGTAAKRVAKSGLWSACTEHDECLELRAFLVDGNGRMRQPSKREREDRRERERLRKAGERARPPAVRPPSARTDAGQKPDTIPLDTTSSLEVPPLSPPQGGAPSAPTDDSPKPKTQRARQIPADFSITPTMRAWATENLPKLDIDAALVEFVTYWAGRGATMLNWEQTWRNGMLKTDRRGDFRKAAKKPVDWMNR